MDEAEWMKVIVSADAPAPGTHLQETFTRAFMAAGAPKDAALFTRTTDDGSHYEYYFSPGAVRIFGSALRLADAEPCESPPREGSTPLVVSEDFWDIR